MIESTLRKLLSTNNISELSRYLNSHEHSEHNLKKIKMSKYFFSIVNLGYLSPEIICFLLEDQTILFKNNLGNNISLIDFLNTIQPCWNELKSKIPSGKLIPLIEGRFKNDPNYLMCIQYLFGLGQDIAYYSQQAIPTPLELWLIIFLNRLSLLENLLQRNKDIKLNSADIKTILKLSAMYGHYEMTKFLLKHPLFQSISREIDLMKYAAKLGNCKLLELLFQNHSVKTIQKESDDPQLESHIPINDFMATKRCNPRIDISALSVSARYGHLKATQFLIKSSRQKDRQKALFEAARYDRCEIINFLLDSGVDVNAQQESIGSALHRASLYGCVEAAELLIKRGADVSIVDEDIGAPLHLAAAENNTEIMKLLFKNNVKTNVLDEDGYTPFFIAVKCNALEAVLLFHEKGASIEEQDSVEEENTPLLIAAEHGSIEVINFLLSKNAKMDAINNFKKTVLHCAAKLTNQTTETIPLLIKHGAKIETRDNQNRTPLLTALYERNVPVVKALIDAGANITAEDNEYKTALHFAARINYSSQDFPIFETILKHCNINKRDKDGRTPLHYAAMYGCCNNIALLAKNKMLIDATDKEGCTPLFVAIGNNNNLPTVQQLIKAGASVHKGMKKDLDIITPLQRAIDYKKIEVIKLLLESGANINPLMSFWSVPLVETDIKILNAFKETVLLHDNLQRNSSTEILSLLDQNPIVNFTDANLDTPLHRVIKSTLDQDEKISIIQKLLEKKSRIYMKNSQGLYPFELPEADNKIKILLISIEIRISRVIDEACIHLIQKLSRAAYQLNEDVRVCSPKQYYPLPKHLISDILFYEIQLLVNQVENFHNLNNSIINLLSKALGDYFITKDDVNIANFCQKLTYYTLSSEDSKNIHALICNLQVLNLDFTPVETLKNFKQREENMILVLEEFVQEHQLKPIENLQASQISSVNEANEANEVNEVNEKASSLISQTNHFWTQPNNNNSSNNHYNPIGEALKSLKKRSPKEREDFDERKQKKPRSGNSS